MAKFQLTASEHSEAGKIWVKGDVFESPHPLDRMFKNKFRRVHPNSRLTPARPTPKEGDLTPPLPELSAGHWDENAADPPGPGTLLEDVEPTTYAKTAVAEPVVEEVLNGDDPEFGRDVTNEFPEARDADLLVFQRGDDLTLVDRETPDKPLNKRALHRIGVPKAIHKYLK